jgi:hypothetical protein
VSWRREGSLWFNPCVGRVVSPSLIWYRHVYTIESEEGSIVKVSKQPISAVNPFSGALYSTVLQ